MSEFKPFEFETIMRNENFIVRDHRVHHVRIMPGVTFLDMIWRLLKREGYPIEQLALRNIVFKEAVSTTEAYDKRIRIVMVQESGRSVIRCKSLKVKEGRALDTEWDDNFQCELAQVQRPLAGRMNVAAMKAQAERIMDIEEMYATAREVQIHHYEFMKTHGKVYITPNDFLAEVNLSELAKQYLPSFFVHPAILDTATFIPFLLHNYGPDPKPYIPLFIEAFRASRSLVGTCYIHAPRNLHLEKNLARDVNFSDLGLYDSEGELVAVFKKLTEKQIRGEGLIKRLTTVEGEETAAPQVAPQVAPTAVQQAAQAATQVPQAENKRERMALLLCDLIAPLLGVAVEKVDRDEGFYEQGLESTDLLKVVAELERHLKLSLYPTLLFEYTTVNELAGFLEEEVDDAVLATPVPVAAAPPVAVAAVAAPVGDKRGAMVQLLRNLIAPLLDVAAEQVDGDEGFYEQGLESTDLLKVVSELESRLQLSLYPTLLFEYTTLNELAGYLADEVTDAVVAALVGGAAVAAPAATPAPAPLAQADQRPVGEQIVAALQQMVAAPAGLDAEQVPTNEGFYEMGLESTDLLEMVRALEDRIGSSLYPTLLFEYTTIEELAGFLEENYATAFAAAVAAPVATAPAAPVAHQASEVVRAQQVWQSSLLEAHSMHERIGKAKSVLVFEREDTHFNGLKARFAEQDMDVPCYRVKAGRSYRREGDCFVVRPNEAEDYQAMLAELAEQEQLPDYVALLWTKEDDSYNATAFRNQVHSAPIAWMLLTQALMQHKPKRAIRLLHAYRRPEGAVLPVLEGLTGFARSLRLENPKFQYRMLAIDDVELDLEQILIDEWCAQDETQAVLYNSQGRHVRELKLLDAEAVDETRLREGGVYVITGGLGGLGLIFAEYLAKHYKAKLVLTGRSEPDDAKRAKMDALREQGAEVLFVASDIAQNREVDALAEQVRDKFGALHGVIHAAGVLRDSMLMRKSLADLEAVMAAKVYGTVALAQLIDSFELDFLALFSSTTAVSGTAGQTDYAYANTFMDAFAEAHAQKKTRVVAINWPLWRDGGMQVDDGVLAALEQQEGMRPMAVETGMQAFEQALLVDSANYIVIEGIARRICEVFGLPLPVSQDVEVATEAIAAAPAATYDMGDYQAPTVAAQVAHSDLAGPAVEDVAIIGVAGRYPQAEDVRAFWENLKAGIDCIEEVPAERWYHGAFFNEDKQAEGTSYSKWGGFIDKVDKFDPLFFNIAPKEAELMEPQERLFLQTAWHTFEDAGYARSQLGTDNVGVFVGVMWGQYQLLGLEGNLRGETAIPHPLYATIANRVSYCLNLRGPSMALDTMCSSSLTTIHLACQAIQKGECDLAVAGGVNLTLHPVKYTYLSQEKMLATDGRCRSFGEGGDGYVPGEGVGAVLLKPLSKALADGDFIYATIKGSTLNHGGKSSGYSVPDPNAQARLVESAFRNAGVSPDQFSYLETHGTGTALGDPIEITGMGKAFKDSGMPAGSLAIGSVKSNIGHLESAAGIAGVTKILLQMQHRQLVPSLHSAALNEKIPFERTPFRVQQDLAAWQAPRDATGQPRKRIAGISSFGAGGSNAHIVFEEAPPFEPVVSSDAQVILLSAKQSERLQAYAQRWLDFVDAGQLTDQDLVRVAWTTQVGREPMPQRAAIVARDLTELRRGLLRILELGAGQDGVAMGKAVKGAPAAQVAGKDAKSLFALAQAWVEGASVDWAQLHAVRPQRMPLPLYPFAEERYWLPGAQKPQPRLIGGGATATLHPLITHNISTYYRMRFVTEFAANAFAFADHEVNGRGLLPGVVYVEMARAAASIALEQEIRHLANIAFEAPLWAPQSGTIKLFVDLEPLGQHGLQVVLRSDDAETGTVHFQCQALLNTEVSEPSFPQDVFAGASSEMSHEQAYAGLAAEGFRYGGGFRSIERILIGDTELGVEVRLPDDAQQNLAEFGLHPGLLDGLLHAVIGLDEANGGAPEHVPYQIGDLYFLRPMTPTMRGVLQAKFAPQDQPELKPYDGALFDDQGRACVVLHDSVMRMPARAAKPNLEVFEPVWRDAALDVVRGAGSVAVISQQADLIEAMPKVSAAYFDRFWFAADHSEKVDWPAFYARLAEDQELQLILFDVRFDYSFRALVSLMLYNFSQLHATKLAKMPKLVVLTGADPAVQDGLAALMRSLQLESSRFVATVVGLEEGLAAGDVARAALAEHAATAMAVRLHAGKRQVRDWQPVQVAEAAADFGLEAGQTVLITGGLGGLGWLYAQHLAEHEKVNLALLNRSPLNDARREQIKALEAHGVKVRYVAADISDADATLKAVAQVREQLGGLHGVIHAAGVLRDGLALRKTDEDVTAVLASKVQGTLNLDTALADVSELRFWLLCSSVAAVGSEGQCDYACGNGFLNGFAVAREARRKAGEVAGRTLSIGWPLWRDGGMSVADDDLKALEREWGMLPLATADGLAASMRLLASQLPCADVIYGYKSRMLRRYQAAGAHAAMAKAVVTADQSGLDDLELQEQLYQLLADVVAGEIKLDPKRIDLEAELEDYGIDSVMIVNLTDKLSQHFGSLSKTLLFEYTRLVDLAGYFLREHAARLHEVFAPTASAGETEDTSQLIRQPLRQRLLEVLAGETKLRVEQIDREEELENYGIDSVMTLNLTERLSQVLGLSLSKTLFYEFTTLADLENYFIEKHAAALQKMFAQVSTAKQATTKALVKQVVKQATLPASRFSQSGAARLANEPVAIVGMSGRFPMADDLEAFWQNLQAGLDCISHVPASRWDRHANYFGAKDRFQQWGGFMEGIEAFDPYFFNMTPREAAMTDPQERLFLETVYHVLEDAGYAKSALARKAVGVFVGVMWGEYSWFGMNGGATPDAMYASIANRVSYWFDFKGPSMALDTMCSSSLTAIHLACRSLREGESEYAIAGGVNVSIHPYKYKILSERNFPSSDGRCRAFGAGGDGYVPGEGVGALMLKRLSQAEADGDHIYGLLRATALNHGGKSNGYTVPNPAAQYEVIHKALEQAQIDPRTMGYIEAHGTGTALGDPIEIAGLKRAFAESGAEQASIALGSVKSNVGHCESAAGVAGIIKVVLQMQHRQLVPSLHAETLNPDLDIDGSAFRVQRQLQDWSSPQGQPLRAGLSSFGAGGSNAHFVIEDYSAAEPSWQTPDAPWLFVLSAQNDARLRDYAGRFATFLTEQAQADTYAGDLVYTLMVGREVMDERLVVLFHDLGELKARLQAFVNGEQHDSVFAGNARQPNANAFFRSSERAREQIVQVLLQEEDWQGLAELMAQGLKPDWQMLYGELVGRRIPLPKYPFERLRCWVPDENLPQADGAMSVVHGGASLHPLITHNLSSLYQMRFVADLDANAFYFADHVIDGKKLLPGAVYLEMARAAAALAFESEAVEVADLVWQAPLWADQERVKLMIDVFSESDREVTISLASAHESGEQVHATCRVRLAQQQTPAATFDQQALEQAGTQWSAAALYDALAADGFAYGASLRPLQSATRDGERLLAALELPAQAPTLDAGFVLHPVLLDGVLQALVVFDQHDSDASAFMPYGLGRVTASKPLTKALKVVIERRSADQDHKVYDANVFDDAGDLCLSLHGITLKRQLRQAVDQVNYFEPVWQAADLGQAANEATGRALLISEDRQLVASLRQGFAGEVVVAADGAGSDFSRSSLDGLITSLKTAQTMPRYVVWDWSQLASESEADQALALLHGFQAWQAHAGGQAVKFVLLTKGEPLVAAGLAAMLRSLHLESPRFLASVVHCADALSSRALAAAVTAEFAAQDVEVMLRDGARLVRGWRAMSLEKRNSQLPLDRGDVVVITGGLGGLGWLFAQRLAEVYGVNLVLVNRSQLNAERRAMLEQLRGLGVAVLYQACDISDEKQVRDAVAQARDRFGVIHGVIHAAGVLRDGLALRKADADLITVLAAKVTGTKNLDAALADETALKFFALFASVSAAGSDGQCDYAFANNFQNAFAFEREQRRQAGACYGVTLALGWPLWASGGMQVDGKVLDAMYREWGMKALDTQQGIAAFASLLDAGVSQPLVIYGDAKRAERRLRQAQQHTALPQESQVTAAQSVSDEDVLRKGLRGLLLKVLADEIQLDPSRIKADEDLEHYGIDSVMVLNLTEALSQPFGELSKTLLFEYRSLSELEAYFMEAHAAQLQTLFGKQTAEQASVVQAKSETVRVKSVVQQPRKLRTGKPGVGSNEPIAIVGMAGRFPMAEDLAAFWANLQKGLDCITEVPAARWDKHAAFYGSEKPLQPFGGFLDGVDQFDPYFFNMTPREAEMTDPQERLFLETVHQTVEDAGYAKSALAGKPVGVYVGVMWGEYAWFGLQGGASPGALHAAIANRVSYWFDFKGPSVGLDTMCSSSLTAIHFACQALREGKLEVGIAGGVNVSTHPYKYKLLSDMNFPSTDGRCRAFGAGGDGYVPSEGVGAVMLKRLSQAEADGDHIYAVLRATELNHGGKTNGFTVPNPVAQAEVVAASLRESGVDPATISYIEAHGTGTALGDPIEISGLKRAFKGADLQPGSVAIGSVKSNIGHCESTAGMAGLIKVLLQMQHRQLVPSLHAETLNPDLGIAGSPFKVQRQLSAWQKRGPSPLRAGLSSFGAGGSNAHFVIEAYEAQQARQLIKPDHPWLFLLSAQNEARLQAYVTRFIDFLQDADDAFEEMDDTPLLAPVSQALLAGFAKVLDIAADALDARENPVDWGFDAIQQQRLIEHLEKDIGVAVPQNMWDAESVAAMASVWCSAQAADLARVFKVKLQATQAGGAESKVRQDLYEGDLVFTLMQGREPMPERLGLVFDDLEDLLHQLQEFLKDGAKQKVFRANVRKTNAAAFLSGNERAKQQFIDALLQEADWQRVAELWVLGVGLDWQALYGEVPARRVSLPSYPFERGSYWLPDTHQPIGVAATSAVVKPEYVVLNKQWREINPSGSQDIGAQRLLIMATVESESLARQLFADDSAVNCQVLLAGRDFSMDDSAAGLDNGWRVRMSDLPTALIDLTDLSHAHQLDALAKFRLWQDVLAEFRVQPFALLHLTQQRVAVGDGAISLVGSVAAAMTRVLAAEVRSLHARTVDVDQVDADLVKRVIVSELQRQTAETEVIYRNGKAFTPTLAVRHRSSQMNAQKLSLNFGKSVWITGGTRGIGAALAVHMVNQGAKRLVLLGRSDLPDRSEWDTWCSKYPNDQTTQKIKLVRDLEAHGAKVDVHGVDLSDVQALAKLKAETGEVGTLIHCAGLPSDDPPSFVKKPLDDMARVLQPKVSGLTALFETFAEDNLDALILVSSMSAQLPQVASGAADYAAANAFMDDFASFARQKGVNAYSIQFPNWIETGMGEVKSVAAERFGIQGVKTQEGLHLFDLCLHYGDAVSLPLKMLTQQVSSFDALMAGLVTAPTASATSPTPASGSALPAGTGKPADVASDWLRDLLVRELRFEAERLQPDTEFGDIGVDSVMIAELVTFVEDWLGTQFDPSLFLEYPTLRSLGEHIAENFSEALAQHVGEATDEPVTVAAKSAAPIKSAPIKPAAPLVMSAPMAAASSKQPCFAIVGVGCNLPGGPDPEPFWQMLIQGKHAIQEIPQLRWNWPELYHPEYRKGRSISKWGAFLDGIDYFDPEFFKLSPGEATSLDPLVRQVLESAAKAVNHAGYQQKELGGKRVGVFVGSRIANWNDRLQGLEKNTIAATEQNFIAAHVSHYMNLKGPNLVLDCACSSSLMSIHLACQSILNGDSEMALAGGSDILLDERPYLALSEGRALSPDGRCFTFDENANGFVPGEGCGMLLIKSLDRAMQDGDQIYAVIEASATNNDGRTMGITTPNPEMQVDVIQHALAKANLTADQVSYMECHGTGTKIGDPIELKALTRVFRQHTQENSFCAVGSVKTNIGHLLSAAGVAGVIKLVLALQNKQLPPTLNCSKPNPRFEFETSPFYPNLQAQAWQPRGGRRIAGISGFGFGGTNMHLLLSDGDPEKMKDYQPQRQPLPDLVFNKRRFWLEKNEQSKNQSGNEGGDAFKPFAELEFV